MCPFRSITSQNNNLDGNHSSGLGGLCVGLLSVKEFGDELDEDTRAPSETTVENNLVGVGLVDLGVMENLLEVLREQWGQICEGREGQKSASSKLSLAVVEG